MTTTGFIACDSGEGSLIWGISATEDAALLDAQQGAAVAGVELARVKIMPASAELLRDVENGGGATNWTLTADGVAVTWAEYRSH